MRGQFLFILASFVNKIPFLLLFKSYFQGEVQTCVTGFVTVTSARTLGAFS